MISNIKQNEKLFEAYWLRGYFSSFQFSRSVVSDSLRPHEPQHARPPCPSPTPGVHPNSCPLSRWCHPAISSSVVPFSSYPQSIPASGSFILFYFIFKLYIIVLVLPNIKMNLPQVYMCSPSWTLLPPLSPYHPSGSFKMSQFFTQDGQSIGVSASASVLPMNTQDWSPLGWTGWISFQSKGLARVFSNTTVQKHQFFSAQLSL